MTTADRIGNALAVLGSTPEEVAERLGAEGCFGHLDGVRSCPVFHYLAGRGVPVVEVTWATIMAGHGQNRVVVYNPDAVEQFQIRFDHGKFPRLALEDGE